MRIWAGSLALNSILLVLYDTNLCSVNAVVMILLSETNISITKKSEIFVRDGSCFIDLYIDS